MTFRAIVGVGAVCGFLLSGCGSPAVANDGGTTGGGSALGGGGGGGATGGGGTTGGGGGETGGGGGTTGGGGGETGGGGGTTGGGGGTTGGGGGSTPDAGPEDAGVPDAGMLPDLDGDGTPDASDLDDDGDGIADTVEVGADPLNPINTDGDAEPDFRDLDSDGDGIADLLEGAGDADGDGTGNWRDLDADGDCRTDAIERGGSGAPVDSDGDGRTDFLDRDSDDDGLSDQAEDADCSGARNGTETSATLSDTDGDGAPDPLEQAIGTETNDPVSNPVDAGYLVITSAQDGGSASLTLPFATRIKSTDVYVILDRSGSMSTEITSVKNNLAVALNGLRCPPFGTGDPATCLSDLWAGAGTVGYSGTSDAFRNAVDLQPSPSFTGLPTTEPGGCCAEPLTFSVYAALTGQGTAGAASACGISTVAARSSCATSPAAMSGYATFGYPCFRQGALPVVILATDEPPLSVGDTNKCPAWSSVVLPALRARSARFMGVYGDNLTAGTISDLQQMATDTRSVDAASANMPFVFNGSGTTAATAIQNGLRALVNGIPLDLTVVPADDPTDAVNAVTAFVDHLETAQLGTSACANQLTDSDTNGDTFDDAYANVRTGTAVCWTLASKPNTTVPATASPQLFKLTLSAMGDGTFELDRRDVYFYVPPLPVP